MGSLPMGTSQTGGVGSDAPRAARFPLAQRCYRAWEHFFFSPQSPLPLGVFRIVYGLCVCATLALLHSEWLDWFGVHAWVSRATMAFQEPGVRLNLFQILPQNDHWISFFFWVALSFAVLLTLGLWTRVSSIAVFLCLASIDQRNLLITNGGDTFLRVMGFFLIFSPAGAALSLDRLRRLRRGQESGPPRPRAPWAQRMMQLQLAWLYLTSFLWKLQGDTWRNGTALFYVVHLHQIQRFPVPVWLHAPLLLRLGCWFALSLELALAVLLWFRPFRYPVLLLGLLFHLTLEYSLNLPMIQWDILSAYVLFIRPEDLMRIGRAVKNRWPRRSPAAVGHPA
jgi:hypothetical protein